MIVQSVSRCFTDISHITVIVTNIEEIPIKSFHSINMLNICSVSAKWTCGLQPWPCQIIFCCQNTSSRGRGGPWRTSSSRERTPPRSRAEKHLLLYFRGRRIQRAGWISGCRAGVQSRVWLAWPSRKAIVVDPAKQQWQPVVHLAAPTCVAAKKS